MKKIIVTVGLMFSPLMAEATIIPLNKVTLSGDDGGYFQGDTWDSMMLKGKTTMLMYIDPDEKSKGEVFKSTIEAFEKELDFDKFQIVVILNLKATWKPNALIEKLLENKSKKYPKRIYVLDKLSVLVKAWSIPNDEYNTLVINPSGEMIYHHSGEWESAEIKKINKLIRSSVQ